jgi:hypothetical protein
MKLHRFWPRIRKALGLAGAALGYIPDTFCFVSGTYRSGTTAVAMWVGEQPSVASFSESRVLIGAHAMMREVQRLRSLDREQDDLHKRLRHMVFGHYAHRCHYAFEDILVDKEPLGPIAFPDRDYTDFLRNVRALVPGTKLVLMIRDPVSTVWSMRQRKYGYSLTSQELRTYSLDEHVADWCAGADAVLEFVAAPDVYVCSFQRLTAEPEAESRRLAAFLGLDDFQPFVTKPTKEANFSEEELTLVASKTEERVEALAARGVLVG